MATLSSASQAVPNDESTYQPHPYVIDIDPSLVQQMRDKAASFRHSQPIAAPAWFDGPPTSRINSIANFWAEEYDWDAVQSQINSNFSHFITTVTSPGGNYSGGDLGIHFIHERSPRDDAIPMLMLHGWPSTSLEWERVILPLANPDDEQQPAFHIVAPDLPGYGFSQAPTAPGLGPSEHATVFDTLMQQLGYNRYALYGTDLGFIVSRRMVDDYTSNIINHVTDFYLPPPNSTDLERYQANETTPEESTYISSINAFFANHSAYADVHSTFPLSLAYALTDSPVGFLAWMYQLDHTVSDEPYTASELITNAILLWAPGVYGNIRSYKELYPGFQLLAEGDVGHTDVPTSVLQFGGTGRGYEELKYFNYAPRAWVERTANVTYFSRHRAGGHFPATSQPQLVIDDIRAIFA